MSARLLGIAFAAGMPTHVAKLILLKLVDEARDDGGRCFPSVQRIADAAQCSRRHVQRLLRKFERVGLVSVEAEGGAGRGDTTEYRLNVALLERIGEIGWATAIGPASDDAEESPKETDTDAGATGEKSDAMSPLPERATAAPNKRDTGDTIGRHVESPNPLRDPLSTPEERRGRARRAFRELLIGYPDAALDDLVKAERFYDRLGDAAYDLMWERLPAFRAFLKGKRRRPPLQDFLRDQLWETVEAAAAVEPASDGKIPVKRYSRGMWALFWRCDQAGVSPVQVVSAVSGGTWRISAERAPTKAEEERLVMVAVKSDEFAAWLEYAVDRWPDLRFRFPVPDQAEFAWMPAQWPSTRGPPGSDQSTSKESELEREGAG